jgi:fatty acid-binding protein 6
MLNASSLSQATVKMEGGKVVAEFPNYHQTSEVVGDKLVEVSVQKF